MRPTTSAQIATSIAGEGSLLFTHLGPPVECLDFPHPGKPARTHVSFGASMRIWVDISGPAHVLVLRPIIERLRAAGHTVEMTSREYTQTSELLALHRMEHTRIGSHAGASRVRKAAHLAQRTAAMIRFGRRRRFDLALAHGSNDLAIAARALGVPEANMHDYEYAVMQHRVGCRLARRVIFPEFVPAERLRRFGVGPAKLRQYPGLKEEYYLADFEPDPTVSRHARNRSGTGRRRPAPAARTSRSTTASPTSCSPRC